MTETGLLAINLNTLSRVAILTRMQKKKLKGLFFYFGLEKLEKHILLIKTLATKAGNVIPKVYIFYSGKLVNFGNSPDIEEFVIYL